mmetsp:Transcript_30041/g.77666  ORF Transcript_30041/g.77666 Transcript_30041/m.77666 type:complete len:848 (-) Transcript_30041:135-2678(-)|eukprot:jgi/Tetstr1/439714/TSEL_028133.t1
MEDNTKLLQFKNQKLREQVEVQKREKVLLEETVQALQGKQSQYETNLLCVNRLWTELNRDIAVLASRIDPSISAVPLEDGSSAEDGAKALAGLTDPFLQRLVLDNPGAEKKAAKLLAEASTELDDVEARLTQRCENTKSALSKVLDAIDKTRAARKEEEPGTELSRLRDENMAFQRELDALLATSLAADSRNSMLVDELIKAEKQGVDLSNELADKHEEITVLHKKLITARTKAEEDERSSAPVASTSAPSTDPRKMAAAAGDGAIADNKDAIMSQALVETRRILEKRNMEIEEERKVSRQLKNELREAKLQLQDESRVAQSKLYQDVLSRLNMLNQEFARHRDIATALRRDMDIASCRETEFKIKMGEVEKMERMFHITEARARDLEIQKISASKARDEAQAQLQALREQIGKADTVKELKLMVATLQKEISVLQANNAKHKATTDKMQALQVEAEAARLSAETLTGEKQHWEHKLKAAEANAEAAAKERDALAERVADLHVFVEVLQSCSLATPELAEATAAAERAKVEVAELKAQLEEHAMQKLVAGAQAAEKEARQLVETREQEKRKVEQERDSLRRQLAEFKEQLKSQKGEMEAYIQEIDVIGRVYEDMQAQNTRLLQQITERDALNHQLQNERLQLDQKASAMTEEKATYQSKVTHAESKAEVLRKRVSDAEAQIQRLMEDIAQGKAKFREADTAVSETKQAVKKLEETLAQKQIVSDSYQKQLAESQRAAQELGDKLDNERTRRQRGDEEVKTLKSRLERMKRSEAAAGLNKELEDELEDMRTLLRCNVCHERQKDVIITKCYHMFCKPCIDRNLSSRHRKCPGCGVAFGTADVKSCFFT